MSNTIKLKSVRDLMEVNYFIPSYQRGYRWTKPQIEDLLNDVFSFAIKKDKGSKEFYCLQPIVVREVKDSELKNIEHLITNTDWKTYEVIDGQQRLTTIKILLIYLLENYLTGRSFKDRYGTEIFNIIYETRPELSSIFLDRLNIISSLNIDYDHITNAYALIGKWFEKRVNEGEIFDDVCDSLIRTLVYSEKNKKPEGVVQVIWYEINDGNVNPIETFLRINLGKIPLTNAELVKALFLQETLYGQGDLADLQQIEIAQKWDFIERSLQDEKFWWFLSNEKFEGSTRIDYLLNIYYQIELAKNPDLKEITGDDNNQIFRFYNHQLEQQKSFQGVQEIWSNIENIFDQVNEWYQNPKWFHYIGFLIYKKYTVLDIFNLISKKEEEIKKSLTKAELTDLLVKEISKGFSKIKRTKNITDDNTQQADDVLYLDITYKDSVLVRDLLLLYNLEYIVKHSEKNELIYKFPFFSFKNLKNDEGEKISWDIEHIDSSTGNGLDKLKDQKLWLNNALVDVILSENLIKEIKIYLLKETADDNFQSLYDEVKKVAKELDNDERLKNNIGNLTLLDSKTNRGYGNALFITKRRIIIEKDKKGVFIPQLTKNVFLKYTNVNNLKSQWTREDIELYNVDILTNLAKFL